MAAAPIGDHDHQAGQADEREAHEAREEEAREGRDLDRPGAASRWPTSRTGPDPLVVGAADAVGVVVGVVDPDLQGQGHDEGEHGIRPDDVTGLVGGTGADEDGGDGGGQRARAGALDPLGQGGHGVLGASFYSLRRKSGSSSGPRGPRGPRGPDGRRPGPRGAGPPRAPARPATSQPIGPRTGTRTAMSQTGFGIVRTTPVGRSARSRRTHRSRRRRRGRRARRAARRPPSARVGTPLSCHRSGGTLNGASDGGPVGLARPALRDGGEHEDPARAGLRRAGCRAGARAPGASSGGPVGSTSVTAAQTALAPLRVGEADDDDVERRRRGGVSWRPRRRRG